VLVAVGDLAEDDVLAIEPAGLDGGDEELGAVADERLASGHSKTHMRNQNVRVGASVGHGEQTGLGVGNVEVLIGELVTVDGLATGTLFNRYSLAIDLHGDS